MTALSPIEERSPESSRRPHSIAIGMKTEAVILSQKVILSNNTQIAKPAADATTPLVNSMTPPQAKRRNTIGDAPSSYSPVTARRTLSWRKRLATEEEEGDGVVAYGTKIGEHHRNYVLMYDMLTGIRIAVSRCEAKPPKDLTFEDFKAAHKLAFDIVGNELTPSSKYDFKFKDYAPWVFRRIREIFKIDAAEYLMSLTGRYVLSELDSPGKSGSFFYYSQDYRFIIKTIHHSEHLYLMKILQKYYDHVSKYGNTLVSRFFGLHRVKLPGAKKIHFVVMGNIFPADKDIHEIYDLKGSTVGRFVQQEDLKNPLVVMKDLNWLEKKRKMQLGNEKCAMFLEQIIQDTNFLRDNYIMDYSLLIGIHYISRGNLERIRGKSLSLMEPQGEGTLKIVKRTDANDEYPTKNFPTDMPSESATDDGGFRGTLESGEQASEIYYVGIIDILTPYNLVKRLEHAFKSLNHEKTLISAVNPKTYAERFVKFMKHGLLKLPEQDVPIVTEKDKEV